MATICVTASCVTATCVTKTCVPAGLEMVGKAAGVTNAAGAPGVALAGTGVGGNNVGVGRTSGFGDAPGKEHAVAMQHRTLKANNAALCVCILTSLPKWTGISLIPIVHPGGGKIACRAGASSMLHGPATRQQFLRRTPNASGLPKVPGLDRPMGGRAPGGVGLDRPCGRHIIVHNIEKAVTRTSMH